MCVAGHANDQHKGLFQVKSNNLLKSSFIPSNQNYQTPKEMV